MLLVLFYLFSLFSTVKRKLFIPESFQIKQSPRAFFIFELTKSCLLTLQMSSQRASSFPSHPVPPLLSLPQRSNCTPSDLLLHSTKLNSCSCSSDHVFNLCKSFVYLFSIRKICLSKNRIFFWRSRKGRKKMSVKKGYILRKPK